MKSERLWTDADERAFGRARQALDAGDLTGALMAVSGASSAAVARTRHQLAEWAADVAELATDAAPEIQAAALRHVLVDRGRLMGDTEQYYDVRNCLLPDVVERRRGMPILLSSVWMIVGARAGVPVCGVGLPGHFIARVGADAAGQLVDPFSAGRPLTDKHCKALVRQLTDGRVEWDDALLDATHIDDLVARVLRNIQICHQKAEAHHPLYRTARLTARLFPERPMFQLIHAQVAELIGITPMAVRLYEAVIERFPKHNLVVVARRRLEQLAETAPSVH